MSPRLLARGWRGAALVGAWFSVTSTAAGSARSLPPALLPPPAALASGAGSGGPELVYSRTEEVVGRRTEADRREATGAIAWVRVEGDALEVEVDVEDTCREREVEVVQVTAFTEGAGGPEARKTMTWVGVGGLAVAALGLVAPMETDGLDPVAARALYSGAFGGIGVFALARASQMRLREVGSRTEERPGAWRETPCPGVADGRSVTVDARVGDETVLMLAGQLSAEGRAGAPLEPGATAVAEAMSTLPPGEAVELTVRIDGGLARTVALPDALRERGEAPRRKHAAKQLEAALAEARRDRQRGQGDEARMALSRARRWSWDEQDEARIADALAAVEAAEERAIRRSWPPREAIAFSVCRRVRGTVSSFESTVRRLARRDPVAAEAHIAAHRDRVQREMEKMGEAVEDLGEILEEMRHLGESDASVQRFGLRVQGACGR